MRRRRGSAAQRRAGLQARRRSADFRAPHRDPRGARSPSSPDRRRRHRFGQEHAAAAVLPGARPRRASGSSPTPSRAASPRAPWPHASPRSCREPVGETVGFRVRFADQVSEATRLVLMTDGLLLAELASDPILAPLRHGHRRRGARTLAQRRSACSGVLKRILPRRPDLKLIVTSATLALERVSRFFDGAPILKVSGRNHPIEVRYAAADGRGGSGSAGGGARPPFRTSPRCRGRSAAAMCWCSCRGSARSATWPNCSSASMPEVEVLTLYSRLSWEQQSKIFKRGPRRRIVLATNVAETSITVPGIRAVIDSGLARISRYSPRNRLQRLPIEPVSRASAEQRKGRCGRIGPGLCLRLYSQENFEARPEFTEPEVLRTNLAALLLRLAADGLGEAESFPFIDPPDSRALADGYRLLQELQALDAERRITGRGRAMARLPLDPRLSRALLESRRFHAESELLAIVAGLSVPDARIAGAEDAQSDAARSRLRGLEIRLRRARQAVARLPQGARGAAARAPALVQGAPALAGCAAHARGLRGVGRSGAGGALSGARGDRRDGGRLVRAGTRGTPAARGSARRGGGGAAGGDRGASGAAPGAGGLGAMSADWLRQVPRYLKAEERRWQRVLRARSRAAAAPAPSSSAGPSRHRTLKERVDAELRRPPELEELRALDRGVPRLALRAGAQDLGSGLAARARSSAPHEIRHGLPARPGPLEARATGRSGCPARAAAARLQLMVVVWRRM